MAEKKQEVGRIDPSGKYFLCRQEERFVHRTHTKDKASTRLSGLLDEFQGSQRLRLQTYVDDT
jgi:DNA polymerase sigma